MGRGGSCRAWRSEKHWNWGDERGQTKCMGGWRNGTSEHVNKFNILLRFLFMV